MPLSQEALAVLAECPRFDGNPYLFVSPMLRHRPLSNMACQVLFRRMGVNATLHGTARSTISDWAHDNHAVKCPLSKVKQLCPNCAETATRRRNDPTDNRAVGACSQKP